MLKKHRLLIIFILTEIIIAFFGSNNSIKHNPDVASLLTGLFLIAIPLLYYLLTRKKQTEFTFWFVFYSIFKLTPYIFSMENNFFERLFQLKIYLNIAFLLFLIWKAVLFLKDFKNTAKQKENPELDAHSIITNSLKKSVRFQKLGKIIAFEICSFYYCFIKWQGDKKTKNDFSGYHNSGVSGLYFGLMLVSVFEAFGFHALLISRNKPLAILLLVLHVYLLINLVGHLKAIFFRTHLVLSQKIVLRYGLFETIEIPIHSILSINKFEGDYEKSPELLKCALLGKLEPHNISLELKNNQNFRLPFGITKNSKKVLFYIDNANDFINETRLKIKENQNLKNT